MILLLLILYTHVLRSMQLRTIYFPLHDVLVCILLWTYTLYIYIYICMYELVLSSMCTVFLQNSYDNDFVDVHHATKFCPSLTSTVCTY